MLAMVSCVGLADTRPRNAVGPERLGLAALAPVGRGTACSGTSPPWYSTVMPASLARAQNGSKTGSAGDRPPAGVITGPPTMTTKRASCSSAHSSSLTALSGSTSVMYGAAKMRSW